MKTFLLSLLSLCLICGSASANSPENSAEKTKKNVTYNEKGEIIKTGVNLGPLPVVAYDADRGFQFGALLNIYDFGNGANYPNPNSQWYIEASAYAKDSKVGSYKVLLS